MAVRDGHDRGEEIKRGQSLSLETIANMKNDHIANIIQ